MFDTPRVGRITMFGIGVVVLSNLAAMKVGYWSLIGTCVGLLLVTLSEDLAVRFPRTAVQQGGRHLSP